MIKEIADGIFVQFGRYEQELRGLVCGEKWCILIDAPRYFDEAEELQSFAKEITPQGVKLALLTHGHLDHTATLQVFDDVTVVAPSPTRVYMMGKGQEELDRMAKDDEDLQKVHQILPVVTYSDETIVYDDTGRVIRCILSPGHSTDSQLILLPSQRIVFGGDTLSEMVPPYFPDGNSLQLQESIVKLADLDVDALVPGHGSILYGEEIQVEKSAAIKYLENLRSKVRDMVEHGMKVSEIRERISWEECSDKPAPPNELMIYHLKNIENMAAEIGSQMVALKKGPRAYI